MKNSSNPKIEKAFHPIQKSICTLWIHVYSQKQSISGQKYHNNSSRHSPPSIKIPATLQRTTPHPVGASIFCHSNTHCTHEASLPPATQNDEKHFTARKHRDPRPSSAWSVKQITWAALKVMAATKNEISLSGTASCG